MKKNLILLLILTLVITFSSCKKDKSLTEVKTIDPTEQKILNFKEQMKKTNKSDETMSIEDAVWNIEAALNYTYCYTKEDLNRSSLNTIKIDSSKINYENNNGDILLSDVQIIYNDLQNDIITSFNELDAEVKYYDLVDVSYINNTFKVYYTFVLNKVIGQDKDWIYWFSAPSMIYKEANKYVSYPAIGSGYYTDVDIFVNLPPNNFATTTNPYGDYLIFYQECSYNSPQYVIGDWEMNYYYHHADDALAEARNNIPTGYTFKSWSMDSMEWYYSFYDVHHRVHYINVYYGILHAGGSQGQ